MVFTQKLVNFALNSVRGIQTSVPTQNTLKKFVWTTSGFNKYGLLADDLLDGDHNEDVKEALRRLPQHILDERNYRHLRAFQLAIQKSILPKNEWTKFEEDKPYLLPLVKEVAKERLEKEKWNSEH